MGIKTTLSLEEANALFSDYTFETITPTSDGIIDTTYIVSDHTQSYVLKRFEEATASQISTQQLLLTRLQQCHISVPALLASSSKWHLYTLLQGRSIGTLNLFQLQKLGQTIAKMHLCTLPMKNYSALFEHKTISNHLSILKHVAFSDYKKLSYLKEIDLKDDGLIHGDLFADNLLFEHSHLAIIDFIDAGRGSFLFDLAVAAVANVSTPAGLNLLLRSYNQQAPQKISYRELIETMQTAADFYTLKRLMRPGSLSHKHALQKSLQKLQRSL